MKHKILGVAALLCAMLFAACSDLLEDLTPKETSSVEVETMADTDLYVHILEISGDFTLESEQSGTELRFTALDTEPGANLVWKVYKGLEDTAYTQSGSDTSFGFDTGDLEPGKYTLLVTSGTRSATAVFTVNTTGTGTVTLKTGGDINSILMQLCPSSGCTKFARSVTNNEEATLYLDTEGKYIPVWSKGTEVYYYVPDGCTPVMNEDSSEMFKNCYNLTSLDVDGFDTSNVTNMSKMFNNCSGLTSLDLSKFDTSNVTDMSGMFSECRGLTSLDLSKFVTSKVENMTGMFGGCSGLTSLDLSSFDTSNVTDMSYMFTSCYKLTSLDVSKFDTGSVTDMNDMFIGCSGLTSLDLSSFDTSNVTNMEDMFAYCDRLMTIYATDKFVTTSVTSGDYCFDFCSELRGGAGTTYDENNIYVTYARIDGGPDSATPGYFTLKLIGSKSKPDAVGDIVFSDGSATPYTADLTLTEEQKAAAIAVIFYVGTECSNDSTSRTLGVGLAQNQSGLAWCLSSAKAYNVDITTIQESDKDGSDNLSQIGEFLNGNNDTGTADNYPAFYFAKNYSGTATNLGETYADGWYLPAKAELQKIYDILSTVNKGLAACDGTTFDTDGVYWSSSQFASFNDSANALDFYVGGWYYYYKDDDDGRYVCAVRAFN